MIDRQTRGSMWRATLTVPSKDCHSELAQSAGEEPAFFKLVSGHAFRRAETRKQNWALAPAHTIPSPHHLF
jgi:hypothetical protein